MQKRLIKCLNCSQRREAQHTSLIDEMIGGLKVVKAYGYEDESVERFDEINERLKGHSLKAIFFSSLTNPCTRFVK